MRAHLFVDAPLAAGTVAWGLSTGAWWPLALAGAGATLLHTWGVVHPRASYYMRCWWRLPAGTPHLALTFDDGPHPEHTPAILDLLAAHGQRATFFVIGEHVRRQPALARRIRAEGHTLGLHSFSHSRWFNCWTPARVARDIADGGAAIADAVGEAAPTLFRPPVGLKNPLVGEAVRRLRLTTVTWTRRGWDTGGRGAEAVAATLARSAAPRAILVLHDGHEPGRPAARTASVEALARLLPVLRDRGLTSRALIQGIPRGIACAEA